MSDLPHLQSVNIVKLGNVDVIKISRADCTGSVSLLGGQVLSYTPTGETAVLWHNENIDFNGKSALRQGIPVCWPWFGVLEKNPDPVASQFSRENSPNHGLVKNTRWSVVSITEDAVQTEVVLTHSEDEEGLAITVYYSFGKQLKIRLISTNTSTQSKHLSFALHSYFAVSDINNARIISLDKTTYADALLDFSPHQQQGDISFNQEVDRIYFDTPAEIRLSDSGLNRDIVIVSTTSHSSIVWNPWTKKSQDLSQFSPTSFRHMICIETAKAWTDAIEIPPSNNYEMSLRIYTEAFS